MWSWTLSLVLLWSQSQTINVIYQIIFRCLGVHHKKAHCINTAMTYDVKRRLLLSKSDVCRGFGIRKKLFKVYLQENISEKENLWENISEKSFHSKMLKEKVIFLIKLMCIINLIWVHPKKDTKKRLKLLIFKVLDAYSYG